MIKQNTQIQSHKQESFLSVVCIYFWKAQLELERVLDLTHKTQTRIHTQQSAHIADCHRVGGTVINTIH